MCKGWLFIHGSELWETFTTKTKKLQGKEIVTVLLWIQYLLSNTGQNRYWLTDGWEGNPIKSHQLKLYIGKKIVKKSTRERKPERAKELDRVKQLWGYYIVSIPEVWHVIFPTECLTLTISCNITCIVVVGCPLSLLYKWIRKQQYRLSIGVFSAWQWLLQIE